jgi:hypothetical protein
VTTAACPAHPSAPGLALAPAGFGAFSHQLLVGNFGGGHISAFDIHSAMFTGQLKDVLGNGHQRSLGS